MPKTVIKRDQSTELYEESKVIRVVVAAGLERRMAERLAKDLSDWLKTIKDDSVSSLALRDKVLELLRSVDPDTAEFYQWYQKTKEIPAR